MVEEDSPSEVPHFLSCVHPGWGSRSPGVIRAQIRFFIPCFSGVYYILGPISILKKRPIDWDPEWLRFFSWRKRAVLDIQKIKDHFRIGDADRAAITVKKGSLSVSVFRENFKVDSEVGLPLGPFQKEEVVATLEGYLVDQPVVNLDLDSFPPLVTGDPFLVAKYTNPSIGDRLLHLYFRFRTRGLKVLFLLPSIEKEGIFYD